MEGAWPPTASFRSLKMFWPHAARNKHSAERCQPENWWHSWIPVSGDLHNTGMEDAWPPNGTVQVWIYQLDFVWDFLEANARRGYLYLSVKHMRVDLWYWSRVSMEWLILGGNYCYLFLKECLLEERFIHWQLVLASFGLLSLILCQTNCLCGWQAILWQQWNYWKDLIPRTSSLVNFS